VAPGQTVFREAVGLQEGLQPEPVRPRPASRRDDGQVEGPRPCQVADVGPGEHTDPEALQAGADEPAYILFLVGEEVRELLDKGDV